MTVLSATAAAPSALPEVLPIFPLAGVVLLPRAKLPLNIFEPRYLIMIEDALALPGRMIGMIQPNVPEGMEIPSPPIYSIGCAGRISSFTENDDGRLLIGLTGICRFEVGAELPTDKPYRQVKPLWQKFMDDLNSPGHQPFDRPRLTAVLQPYFKLHGIDADWGAVNSTADELLVSSLVMICPFAPNERQALLEAPDVTARATLMIALLEMATMQPASETETGMKH